MKIGVISDTHGCAETWEFVFKKYLADSDLILHAGDLLYHGPRNVIPSEYNPKLLAERLNSCPVPIVAACGNCDSEVDQMVISFPIQSPYAHVYHNGVRIVINHGHNLDEAARLKTAITYKASIFITGHTHIAELSSKDGVIFMNPGSPGMTKRADKIGTIGYIRDDSVEIIDCATGDILMAEKIKK